MATDPQIDPPETTYVDTRRVWCDGSGQIRGGAGYRPSALGHPRVYLQIDESGFAECGYCDRRFVLREAGDDRATDELAGGYLPEEGALDPDK